MMESYNKEVTQNSRNMENKIKQKRRRKSL